MEVNQSLFNKLQPTSIASDMPPLPPHSDNNLHNINATKFCLLFKKSQNLTHQPMIYKPQLKTSAEKVNRNH